MKRKILVILLSLALMLTMMPLTAFADSDTTEPVLAEAGENITVGNVNVEDSDYAVKAISQSSDSANLDASVKVNGNVNLTSNIMSSIAVYAESTTRGKVLVDVSGNVTTKAGYFSKGVFSNEATIKVGGNVSFESNSGIAACAQKGNVQIGGDVSAITNGYLVHAVKVGGGVTGDASITIDGNVSSKGLNTKAVWIDECESGSANIKGHVTADNSSAEGSSNYDMFADGIELTYGNSDITIGNGITAKSAGEDRFANGMLLSPHRGQSTIDVTGDVEARSDCGNAIGIRMIRDVHAYDGVNSEITIRGNLVSDGYGITREIIDHICPADILINGEIKAKNTAALFIKKVEESSEQYVELTVWKASINSNGNVAEIAEASDMDNRTAAKDFEKSINYIIRVTQPSEGGTLTVVDGDGKALSKSHGFTVAHEGDKVCLKAPSGYTITAGYNNGEKLEKDSNGNFYLIVPKGGGVKLSADIFGPGEDPNQMGSDGTAVGEGASAAAADQKITSMKTDTDPKGSKYNKLRLRSVKQTKNSITLKWKSNSKAVKYVIYGNRCGSSTKIRKSVKLYTIKGSKNTTKTIKKIKGTALKKGTYYKFLVVALNKKNNVVSTSKMIHVVTKGGKYTNYKSVSVKKSVLTKALSLKKGKSLTIDPKAIKVSSKLKTRKHVAIRYESSNKKIATVTTKGVIKAKAKGTCYVYVYAQNGVYKKMKVVVK